MLLKGREWCAKLIFFRDYMLYLMCFITEATVAYYDDGNFRVVRSVYVYHHYSALFEGLQFLN